MKRRLIVGLDPGTTVGIALLSFSNELIYVTSKRGMKEKEIIDTITRFGRPVIISTDVPKPPEKVLRIAKQTGAILFSPEKPISEKEKDRIAKSYGVKVDDHGRDALAAAYAAYQHFRPKIENIIARLEDREFKENVVERVLKGEQTLKTVESSFIREEKGIDTKVQRKRTREEREVVELRRKIGELLQEKKRLEKKVEEMKKRNARISRGSIITELEAEIERIKRDREVKSEIIKELERKIRKLEKELASYRAIIDKIKEGVKEGKFLGSPEKVKGEEVLPGLVLGYPKNEVKEWLEGMVEKYRRERKKMLNIL